MSAIADSAADLAKYKYDLYFPSYDVIVSHLTNYPKEKMKSPHSSDKKIIEKVATMFQESHRNPDGVCNTIASALFELDLQLHEWTVDQIKLDLERAIKACGTKNKPPEKKE